MPVVVSHSAFSDPSERHLFSGKVDDGVVDAASSETQPAKQVFLETLVSCEYVGGKRSWIPPDVFHGIIDVRIRNDRKQRHWLFLEAGAVFSGEYFETEYRQLLVIVVAAERSGNDEENSLPYCGYFLRGTGLRMRETNRPGFFSDGSVHFGEFFC